MIISKSESSLKSAFNINLLSSAEAKFRVISLSKFTYASLTSKRSSDFFKCFNEAHEFIYDWYSFN